MTNLDRVDMNVLMKDIAENYHYGLLPFIMKPSRGQLSLLNDKSFTKCINSASKIVMNEGDFSMGCDMLNKIDTLRMNREFMESRLH